MFSDSFSAIMALVIMNFAGILIMFLFVLRSLDNAQKTMNDFRANMQLRLVDIEQRIAEFSFVLQNVSTASSKKPESTEKNWITPLPPDDEGTGLFSPADDLQQMLEERTPRGAGVNNSDIPLDFGNARRDTQVADSRRSAPRDPFDLKLG